MTQFPPVAAPGQPTAIRASDQDRDAALQRLQVAFAEGRLDDGTFDERMRAALAARTDADLTPLLADLPAVPQSGAEAAAAGRVRPSRLAVAYKGSIRRAGRWRVPGRLTTVIYKGGGSLDLRAAELTAPVTRLVVIAYKSRIDVLIPPGVRVELAGFGVTKGWSEQEEQETTLPASAPVVHIRGLAYKGSIEASTRRPGAERRSLPAS